ncbi:TatD family hydrolase [Algibacillus agarilyticus]|uniref:TatD family hydrolase n=1 Tax=Algibacillus agarilyticus TaxID=2234133 RepID=UPI000DD0EB22|nr:TatD family hydrolase [Algibacillus agarilyticus]
MKLIDVGINITNKQFAADYRAVLARALDHGVEVMIATGTNMHESKLAAELAQEFSSCLYSTAGIHPHDAKEAPDNFIAQLQQLFTQYKNVVAIGECGLDFNRDFSPRPIQERIFEQQVELAVELNAPLFMHQRDAHERFKAIISPYQTNLSKAVVHCFTGTESELYDYLDMGFYIGFTGWICDERRGLAVKELTKKVPADRLLIETDAPFLLPRDLVNKPKNRRNEPAFLPHILKTIAQERQVDELWLAAQLWSNSCDFFNLDLKPC